MATSIRPAICKRDHGRTARQEDIRSREWCTGRFMTSRRSKPRALREATQQCVFGWTMRDRTSRSETPHLDITRIAPRDASGRSPSRPVVDGRPARDTSSATHCTSRADLKSCLETTDNHVMRTVSKVECSETVTTRGANSSRDDHRPHVGRTPRPEARRDGGGAGPHVRASRPSDRVLGNASSAATRQRLRSAERRGHQAEPRRGEATRPPDDRRGPPRRGLDQIRQTNRITRQALSM